MNTHTQTNRPGTYEKVMMLGLFRCSLQECVYCNTTYFLIQLVSGLPERLVRMFQVDEMHLRKDMLLCWKTAGRSATDWNRAQGSQDAFLKLGLFSTWHSFLKCNASDGTLRNSTRSDATDKDGVFVYYCKLQINDGQLGFKSSSAPYTLILSS